MQLDLYQVDAFAAQPFEGNPAAVCPLPDDMDWPATSVLQAIALENNLSETAFLRAEGDAYRLRWFTPKMEVDLCGHATLASAWTLFNKLGFAEDEVRFDTRSGRLTVRRDGDALVMDFPASRPEPMGCLPTEIVAAVGGKPEAAFRTPGGIGFVMLVYGRGDDVAALTPDFTALAKVHPGGVAATAPGDGYDFVSRLFAPAKGIDEDPVTGSSHCVLAPYWAGRLGKRSLQARQISARGGDVGCRVDGDRVYLSGSAALYLTSQITI
ncbi:MAG: PhzF family phenazine biosynthesis protein [Alphaproteobacteria bacterium]|jgi:PhzF family phenazine biosynthesis protein